MESHPFLRSLARTAATPLPLPLLTTLSQQKVILPFYHAISDQPPPHLRHVLQTRNTRIFRQDLEWLLRHFEPVEVATLEALAAGAPAPRKPLFHLSFDDGLKEVATVIAPLLREMGIPATFFVNTRFIGNRDLFYRFGVSLLLSILEERAAGEKSLREASEILTSGGIKAPTLREQLLAIDYSHRELLQQVAPRLGVDFGDYLRHQEVYLNEEEIRALIHQGFTVGAHGLDHPLFRQLSHEEQLRQALESTRWLEEQMGVAPLLFSFPFSDEEVPASFFHQVHPPTGKISLTFGISGLKKEAFPRHLHRIPMERGDLPARAILREEYLYFLMKAPFGKNKINR